ncbi:MAG: tRNA (guanosine(37)-N1)-methyltransferase TrmD [Coriobacteriia bacterium]|nr:tRNA (guanosine(37)-N1)-methyltransferase TrmD [Coriobacteriia bacterium]
MRVDIISIFPEMFDAPLSASLLGAAQEKGILDLHVHDLRDYTHDRHRSTDDAPYGGGPGMLMKPEPLFEAIEAISAMAQDTPHILFLSPGGRPFTQQVAKELSGRQRLLLVCGRYEGFDQRALDLADAELSIGDYVLTGGELPAMVVIDAVARLLPGVLGDCGSCVEESFSAGLLEYPQYTRPATYRGVEVPEVLRSGDHARIAAWRREMSLAKTLQVRPDLLSGPEGVADDG